jgi:hypothetical protein
MELARASLVCATIILSQKRIDRPFTPPRKKSSQIRKLDFLKPVPYAVGCLLRELN